MYIYVHHHHHHHHHDLKGCGGENRVVKERGYRRWRSFTILATQYTYYKAIHKQSKVTLHITIIAPMHVYNMQVYRPVGN